MANQTDFTDAPVSMGTTIMACAYDGGVVLGADSRTSAGTYVTSRVSDKLTELSDKVYVCRSGSAADTQNISAYVQWFLQQHKMELGKEVLVQTAAKLAQQMAYNNKNMLEAGLIIAGWDAKEGGQVYGIPLGGTMIRVPFTIGGSGSSYIYGFCDKNWRPGMTEEDCRNFVIRSISHAIARDSSSGGCVRTVTINEDGVSRAFTPGDKLPLYYGEHAQPLQPPMTIGST